MVLVGVLSEESLLGAIGRDLGHVEAAVVNEPGLALQARVEDLLRVQVDGPAGSGPALFVLDDFEQNLVVGGDGAPTIDGSGRATPVPAAVSVVEALVGGIRSTGSRARVIITCRYACNGFGAFREEPLSGFVGADLDKKVRQLPHLARARSAVDDTVVSLADRAIALGAGNPRLLARLDLVLAELGAVEASLIVDRLDGEVDAYREELLLQLLVERQPEPARRLLAQVALARLPVGEGAVTVVADEPGRALTDIDRAGAIGLVEASADLAGGADRYLVSALVGPLVGPLLDGEARLVATRRLAGHLFDTWWAQGDGIAEEQAVELVRLLVAAGDGDRAATVTDRVTTAFVSQARYRETVTLAAATLTVTDDYRVVHNLARAEEVLGATTDALDHYQQALDRAPSDGASKQDDSEKAAILHNMAGLRAQAGDVDAAFGLYEQSLTIEEKIGNARGKAAT